ncbi:MAG: arsenic resistance protein [Corticimicrobacter sp.]|uniref:arsenic resistance protein n=1 Tax=Corticimicrobacter sp. TaxID=2678536 RepID=UPI0032DA5E31
MQLRAVLEKYQIGLYFLAVLAGAGFGRLMPSAVDWAAAITPALACMLYLTFLQVPVAELGTAFRQRRFLAVLLVVNFILVPILVAGLLHWAPADPLLRLGMLFVLLTPCIDYVVTFAHLGRADARLLLASTPVLLLLQMLALPLYLRLFLGEEAAQWVRPEPFVDAFVWMILVPATLAGLTQALARRHRSASAVADGLALLCVPATALVLLVVVAAVMPSLRSMPATAWSVVPLYLLYALIAPVVGWWLARWCGLKAMAGRAVAFSAGTRNSLVVLPLALSVPGAMPLLPAVIVLQTLVELLAELLYIRVLPRWGVSGKAV